MFYSKNSWNQFQWLEISDLDKTRKQVFFNFTKKFLLMKTKICLLEKLKFSCPKFIFAKICEFIKK